MTIIYRAQTCELDFFTFPHEFNPPTGSSIAQLAVQLLKLKDFELSTPNLSIIFAHFAYEYFTGSPIII